MASHSGSYESKGVVVVPPGGGAAAAAEVAAAAAPPSSRGGGSAFFALASSSGVGILRTCAPIRQLENRVVVFCFFLII